MLWGASVGNGVRRRALAAAAAAWLLVFGTGCGGGGGTARPDLPPSGVISSVTWDYGSLTASAHGSDLWALAWASDGNQYAIWGDGGGFGGDDVNGRTQWGVARIEGSAASWRGANVFGGVNPEAPGWPIQDTTGSGIGYKVDSMTAVDGSLVAIMTDWADYPGFDSKIIRSDDFGRSWKNSDGTPLDGEFWDWPDNAGGAGFSPISFVDMGQGYGESTDGFVYFFTVFRYSGLFLGRAPKTSFMDKSTFAYRRSDGSWVSDVRNADAVLVINDLYGVNAVYHPYLKRYLLTFNYGSGTGSAGDDTRDWMMLEGPTLWGPWFTVGRWHDWIDSTSKFQFRISSKWLTDAADFHLIFSGGPPQGSNTRDWDALNVIRGTFSLVQDNVVSPPLAASGPTIP